MFSFILYLRGKQELTGIEVMGGAGRKSHLFLGFLTVLSGGGLWLNHPLTL